MDYRDIRVGSLYEWLDPYPLDIKDWTRAEDMPELLSVENPVVNAGDMFVVLEYNEIDNPPARRLLYDLKVLTSTGLVGWFHLWKSYELPMREMVDISETV